MTQVAPTIKITGGGDATRRVPAHLRELSGKQLHCRYWLPSDPPRALVIILHGYGEHLGRYEELALRLAREGPFLAYGHDHVGHGLSDGPRAYVDSTDEYVTDVLNHVHLMQEEFPYIPTFAVGHSMGGMILLAAALREPFAFNGVVMMDPFIFLDTAVFTPFKVWLAGWMSRIFPQLIVAPRINATLLTRDKAEVENFLNDPLNWNRGSKSKWAIAIYNCLLELSQRMPMMTVPFLLLHGEADEICSPKGSQMLYDQSKADDKSIKMFPYAFHNLYKELPDVREEALTSTVNWILQRTPTTVYLGD